MLRQLGQGSVATGVYAVLRDPSAQVNVATVLSLEQHVLLEELGHLPRPAADGSASVDLAKMYRSLIAGKAKPSSAGDTEHIRNIFQWCADPLLGTSHFWHAQAFCAVRVAL